MNVKLTVEVGALLRRPVRKACLALGLTYDEEKGFLDSLFVVRGPATAVLKFRQWLESVADDD